MASTPGLRLAGGLLLLAGLAAFPLVAGGYPVRLLQEILIWGVFAMSLDLLMGYAGLVSFGHSAFFGLGGYVAGLLLKHSPGAAAALGWPLVAAAVLALAIGALALRVRGVYFIMLTLAFSQMFHALVFQTAWLGAEDGILGIPRPVAILGLGLGTPWRFHAYVVAVFAAAGLLLRRVVRSPFGHVLRGIRENAARMEALGYPVRRYQLIAFVVAGAVGGVAGALHAQLNGQAPPDAFFWTTSGEALLMVIIGGTGTLGGPVLGAAAFILVQSLVSSYTERWMLILGLGFVLLVRFVPGGLIGAGRGRQALRT